MPLMNREQIMEVIPHRDPILLVDEVVEMVPEESIVTRFHVDPAMDVFRGHFPDAPVFPGVYTVESMAQAADILLLSMERYANKTPFFIGIDKVKFKGKIAPGDTIELHVKLTAERLEKAIATCSAEVLVRGEIVATGDVTLAMR